MTRAWGHDELLDDLAGHLRGPDKMVWTDMQLGPSGSPRPDIYLLHKSYSRPMPTAFEVKVSRSDFRSDTTSGKWQSYLEFAGSVTFAVPDGLCTVADIPAGCGLIVRKEQAWRYARRPTVQSVTPPFSACMKLLIDGVSRVHVPRDPLPRKICTWAENASIRKKFGAAVELAARNLAAAEARVAGLKSLHDYEYGRIRADADAYRAAAMAEAKASAAEWERVKREVCEWLGLSPDVRTHQVESRLAELKSSCDADARVKRAEDRLEHARSSVANALRIFPEKEPAAIAAASTPTSLFGAAA